VANANKLNSTVYFFFGVFLGLTALVFFGDLVAFFAGFCCTKRKRGVFQTSHPEVYYGQLQCWKRPQDCKCSFSAAGFLVATGYFAAVFFGVLAFLGLAAFGFTAFFGLAAGFFLQLQCWKRRQDCKCSS
jgi:hypothetical protein